LIAAILTSDLPRSFFPSAEQEEITSWYDAAVGAKTETLWATVPFSNVIYTCDNAINSILFGRTSYFGKHSTYY